MEFRITKDLVFDFLNLVLSLHEHIIDVCKQQYRNVDNISPLLQLNSYIRVIDGEIILEYVPPQEHILISKVLFQTKNSCPV